MNFFTSLKKRITAKKLILFCLTIAAIGARCLFFPKQSGDYRDFLKPWYDQIQALGGFSAIGVPIGNYLVSYIYIIAALTYLPINSLYAIKAVSVLGDILLAAFGGKIVKKVTGSETKGLAAYGAVLFLPTVVLNSAAWAQCDSLYTAFLLGCVYYLLCQKPSQAMICFAIAFVFKLQAVFLAPFLLLMWGKGNLRFRHFFWVPGIYLLTILPAMLMGRPFSDLILVYFKQAGTYHSLSLLAPNLYAFLSNDNSGLYSLLGILFFAFFTCTVVFLLCRKGFSPNKEYILLFALFSVLMTPFLLPHMHERYFYPADVFSVLYAFCLPRRLYYPVLIVPCSFLVVCRYLYSWKWINPALLSLFLLAAFLLLCREVFQKASSAEKER